MGLDLHLCRTTVLPEHSCRHGIYILYKPWQHQRFLFPIMIRGFFVYSLCIDPLAEYFGAYVGYREIARTVIYTFAVIYVLIMYIF